MVYDLQHGFLQVTSHHGHQRLRLFPDLLTQKLLCMVQDKTEGGKIIRVEAHPIPEHPRPHRCKGRVTLVGDAAGYVTKCSGEGIYFAAKSGRMAAEAIVQGSQQVSTCTHYMPEWLGLMCMASCSTTSCNKAGGHSRELTVHLL